MEAKKLLAGAAALFTAALASLLSTTFHMGYMLKYLNTDGYIGIGLFGIVMPLVLIIVVNLSERVKKLVLFSSTVLSVLGSYYTMLSSPNYLFPEFQLDTVAMYFYFVSLGMQFTLFMIATAELGRLSRLEGHAWFNGVAFLAAGGIAAATVASGVSGWLYPVMIVNYILPAGMLVYFLLVPPGDSIRSHQLPETLAPVYLKDTTRGLKMAFFTGIACLSIIVSIGIQGLAIPRPDFFSIGWLFWTCAGAGGFAGALVAKCFIVKKIAEPASPAKQKQVQVSWMLVSIMLFAVLSVVAVLEFFADGFHGSIGSHVANGLLLGFTIAVLFSVAAAQHPPRSLYAHFMFLAFFAGFSVAVGGYLKALDVNMVAFFTYGEYAIYVIAGLGLLTGLLAVAQLVTVSKQARA